MKIPAILKNKYVLYLVLVLSILNILGYLNIRDFDSIVLFCVVGVLSSYYNKNMTVNLLMSIVVTGIVYNIRNRNRYRFFEGLKVSNVSDKGEGDKKSSKEDCDCDDDNKSAQCLRSCKEKMSNKLNYASVDGEDDEDDDEGIGARIDQDSTAEKAYDNLQKVLGEGGIKGLTDETKQLMEQQKMLMGSIKEIKPMMEQAQKMMNGLPDMSKLFGK